MAKKTYRGSCHCGKVRFEAELDLAAGTGKCNCSYCWKVRNWSIGIKPDAFRLLTDKENTREYGFREASTNHHVFCGTCGVKSFYQPRSHPEAWSINLNALDESEGLTITVRAFDGRNWEKARAALE